MTKPSFITKKRVIIFVASIVVIGASLAVLEKTHIINLYEKPPKGVDDGAQTTSTTPTAQSDYSDGDQRAVGNTEPENKGNGIVEDKKGTTSSETDPSTWTTSSTKEIVVHSPSKNKTVTSGTEISGTSTLTKVNFRLIDEVSGEIAQGQISVVNGKFSGTLNFTTSASTGRLDFYGTKADGREFSNVEIPLKF